ncbi:LytR C-terminal domain-containing protein [Mycobacterium sp. M1]|uniref:LytR C-terminal domain-containing protein n=1 Tax=Mycolicibacter acidiphilus TaxID=2835306 RepID=A0ABS5RLZ9_9MYCO|nr:LytR C-terminal domain-containing protein [Mycolicibacter acidiphilus]MBS9535338.1 LytR C-terminal domain-containing protein [Mycolicibacter acidiphilus]
MNDHVPDSTGLPLRAMVMVLLFLGIVFLLVGFQALGSSGGDHDSVATTTTSKPATTTSASAKPEHPATKADVRVYNISEQAGLAGATADHLREAGFNVTEVDNLELPEVTQTTVYFGEAAGEHEAANAVGQTLHVPVEPRIPDVAEQPPGVIVVVAG